MAKPLPAASNLKPPSTENPYRTPLKAGRCFADAAEITTGETYYVPGDDIAHFVKFPAQSGQFIQLAYGKVRGETSNVSNVTVRKERSKWLGLGSIHSETLNKFKNFYTTRVDVE